jgi:hypothetical protein
MIYIVYDKETGVLLRQYDGSLNPCDWEPSTEGYYTPQTRVSLDVLKASLFDVESDGLVPKGDFLYSTSGRAVADSTTEYILALPEGTIYEHKALEDNSLEFTFDEPGPFVIMLTNPLYSPLELTINVEAT